MQLSVVGDPRPVPPGVGLSVFRIVQEALTNVLKHASARRADVTVRYEDDIIAVRVTDDGEGSPDAPGNNGQGHGLIGMRERVALFGGELCAGPDPGGGFTVDARLPLVER